MPQFAADYYGPNEALRAALTESENTWRMIQREAVGNDRLKPIFEHLDGEVPYDQIRIVANCLANAECS